MESMQFETQNEKGEKIICDGIATYHEDTTNKDFIVYTDRTFNEKGELKLYYSLYKEGNNTIQLFPITSLEDRKIGLQFIQEIIKDFPFHFLCNFLKIMVF